MSALTFPDVPLLRCPFCGLEARWFRTGRDVGVECSDGEDCPGRAQTNVYEPQHALMAAGCWNTRNDQAADHYATVLETRDEMLEALQPFVEFNSSEATVTITVRTEDVKRARAAISKARGES